MRSFVPPPVSSTLLALPKAAKSAGQEAGQASIDFAALLEKSLTSSGSLRPIIDSSPLIWSRDLLGLAGGDGGRDWNRLSLLGSSTTPGTAGVGTYDFLTNTGIPDLVKAPTTTVDPAGQVTPTRYDASGEPIANEYELTQVARIDRAPMAMFEHQGELVISAITRSGMSETPVWTYSPEQGLVKASQLPQAAESGHYGYSTGDVLHLTTESWGGMIDYTASDPEGPWTEHDMSHLNPHQYKNLTWGFSYQDPATGQQFMGFGRDDNPGVVLTYTNGGWQTLAAPDDMRFPTGVGVIDSGPNQGTVLVSSSYGGCRIHAVSPDGTTEKIKTFDGWGVLRVDQNERVAYVQTDQGKVYWASFDDLETWKECLYKKPAGYTDSIEGLGEPNIHPTTGKMIFTAIDESTGTGIYEAHRKGEDIVLVEVAWLAEAGNWAGKSAAVGDDFYIGSGQRSGGSGDQVPGLIYRLEAV